MDFFRAQFYKPGIFTVDKASPEWNSALIYDILYEIHNGEFGDRRAQVAKTLDMEHCTYGVLDPDSRSTPRGIGIYGGPALYTGHSKINWRVSPLPVDPHINVYTIQSTPDDLQRLPAITSIKSLGGWILKVSTAWSRSTVEGFLSGYLRGIDRYMRYDAETNMVLKSTNADMDYALDTLEPLSGYYYIFPVIRIEGGVLDITFDCLRKQSDNIFFVGDPGIFVPEYMVNFTGGVEHIKCDCDCRCCAKLHISEPDLGITDPSRPVISRKPELFCTHTVDGSYSYPHTGDGSFISKHTNPTTGRHMVVGFLEEYRKKPAVGLKEPVESVYLDERKSIKSINNKKPNTMATQQKQGMMERIMAKLKGQYIPRKVDGFGLTMDGVIAIRGNDEYLAINGSKIESYPEEAIIKEFPIYAITRKIKDVKVGDIVLIPNGITGKQSAGQVSYINQNKDKTEVTGLTVIAYNGSEGKKTVVKDKLTGLETVEVLISISDLFQMFGGKEDQPEGNKGGMFNPMMLLMMDNGKEGSLSDDKLLMLMMMASGKGNPFENAGGDFNPMMLLMMDKEMSMDKLLMFMMASGKNPFVPGK